MANGNRWLATILVAGTVQLFASTPLRLVGLEYSGATWNGKKLENLRLDDDVLHTANTGLDDHTSAGLELTARDSGGGKLRVRIEGAEPDPRAKDLTLYRFQYFKASTSQWLSPCLPDAEGDTRALLLAGLWDDTGKWTPSAELFTLACTSSAIGKCVRWGYAPWKNVAGRSLRDLHEACTRMVRADYLGDGQTFTKDGTQIAYHDIFGIHNEPLPPRMQFEAAWSPSGAVVVARSRFLKKRPATLVCPDKGLCHLTASDLTREALLFNYSYPLP